MENLKTLGNKVCREIGMPKKITRVSLTLPQNLLDELDRMLKAQGYASRSEAVRDALRDFLANYKWRRELKGEFLGVVMLVYEHDVRGLTDTLMDIQHSSRGVVSTVQHFHMDAKNCLETLIVRGPSEEIRKLVDRLGALRGVKQAKLVVV
ncbi:putative nickel-responsive regulator [subsurface metagenome]